MNDSEKNEFRSARSFAAELKSDCGIQIKNTSTEQINTGENFNLKLVI